jgi:hypothetical protein
MTVADLIEKLREAPQDMEVVISYISKSEDNDFILDADDAGIYPLIIEGEGDPEEYFCINAIEGDQSILGNFSMN